MFAMLLAIQFGTFKLYKSRDIKRYISFELWKAFLNFVVFFSIPKALIPTFFKTIFVVVNHYYTHSQIQKETFIATLLLNTGVIDFWYTNQIQIWVGELN